MAWFCPGFIMYLVPLLLGRTYNVKYHTSGLDIFPQTYIDNAKVTILESHKTNCVYTTVSSDYEKKKLLNIPQDVYMKLQADILKSPGIDQYIAETFDPLSTIHVVIKCTVTTAKKELDAKAVPIDNWTNFNNALLGTHFVHKVVYGGELLAVIIFKAYNLGDKENIKKEVKNIMETVKSSNDLDSTFEGKMSNLIKDLAGVANAEYKYYATVPLDLIPSDVKDLTDLIKKFPAKVTEKAVIGAPVCVDLKPLSEFDFMLFPDIVVNKSTVLEMGMNFESWFEYVRQAKLELKNLLLELSSNIGEDSEVELGEFRDRLNKVLKTFHKAIANLDTEQGPEQFKPALDSYMNNSRVFSYMNRYTIELKEIKDKIKVKDNRQNPRVVYTHWGQNRYYSSKLVKIVYRGYIAGLAPGTLGGGTQYQCLPANPQWTNVNYTGQLYGDESSLVGVTYGSENATNTRNQKITGRLATCSVCEAITARSVEIFVARKDCPQDWTKQYFGKLASFDGDRRRREYICLDAYPEEYSSYPERSTSNAAIVPVQRFGKEVPCVVCVKYWVPSQIR